MFQIFKSGTSHHLTIEKLTMKKIHSLIFIIGLISAGFQVDAQNLVDIRLDPMIPSPPSKACYDVQLRSAEGQDFNLAGQNYRLYYDATLFKFNEEFSTSYFDQIDYTDFLLNQEIAGADATGTGALEYEDNLGFLNFSMDLNNLEMGGVILPADGEWIATTRLCFDLNNNDDPPMEGMHWARAELTEKYATAFVEVSEWTAPFETMPAEINEFQDLDMVNTTTEVLDGIKIYPNPAVDHIMLELNKDGKTPITIWDESGRQVFSNTIEYASTPYRLNISHIAAGAYTIFIKVGEKSHFAIIEKIW